MRDCASLLNRLCVLVIMAQMLGCGQEVFVNGFDVAKKKAPAAQPTSAAAVSDTSGDASGDAF